MKRPCRAVYQLENAAEDHRRDLSDSLNSRILQEVVAMLGLGSQGFTLGP